MQLTDNVNLKVGNFGKPNTPPLIEKIGNALLLIGAAGAATAMLPLAAPVVATVGAWCAFGGALGKVITKFFGKTDGE